MKDLPSVYSRIDKLLWADNIELPTDSRRKNFRGHISKYVPYNYTAYVLTVRAWNRIIETKRDGMGGGMGMCLYASRV